MAEQDYRSMVEQAQRLASQGGNQPGVLQALMTGDFPSARTGIGQALFGNPNATLPVPVPQYSDAGSGMPTITGPDVSQPGMEPLIAGATQLGMLGMGAGTPFAARGALGMAGGKMVAAPKQTMAEIEAELSNALKGTDIHPMDMIGKYAQENAPQAAKDIWAKREALGEYVDKLDAKLEKALKPYGVPLMDIALNEKRLEGLPDNIKAMWAERSRLWGD